MKNSYSRSWDTAKKRRFAIWQCHWYLVNNNISAVFKVVYSFSIIIIIIIIIFVIIISITMFIFYYCYLYFRMLWSSILKHKTYLYGSAWLRMDRDVIITGRKGTEGSLKYGRLTTYRYLIEPLLNSSIKYCFKICTRTQNKWIHGRNP